MKVEKRKKFCIVLSKCIYLCRHLKCNLHEIGINFLTLFQIISYGSGKKIPSANAAEGNVRMVIENKSGGYNFVIDGARRLHQKKQ